MVTDEVAAKKAAAAKDFPGTPCRQRPGNTRDFCVAGSQDILDK